MTCTPRCTPGSSPEIHDRGLDPASWLSDYRTTCVERAAPQAVPSHLRETADQEPEAPLSRPRAPLLPAGNHSPRRLARARLPWSRVRDLRDGRAAESLRPSGEASPVYFWRDSAGHEIDFLIEQGSRLVPVEAKAGETIPPGLFEGLEWWRRLVEEETAPALLLHGGDDAFTYRGMSARSWKVL